jgi:hypothetical protein
LREWLRLSSSLPAQAQSTRRGKWLVTGNLAAVLVCPLLAEFGQMHACRSLELFNYGAIESGDTQEKAPRAAGLSK